MVYGYLRKKHVPGWMGWADRVKAIIRIANSNQKHVPGWVDGWMGGWK